MKLPDPPPHPEDPAIKDRFAAIRRAERFCISLAVIGAVALACGFVRWMQMIEVAQHAP